MKKFKFKLDSVLNARKSAENLALKYLTESRSVHQEEIAKKEKLLIDLKNALSRRERIGSEPTMVGEIHSEESFITGTKQRLIHADQAILRASRSVEKATRSYLQAKRQLRMIEILHDRAEQEFKEKVSAQERRELDDLMVMRNHLKEQEI